MLDNFPHTGGTANSFIGLTTADSTLTNEVAVGFSEIAWHVWRLKLHSVFQYCLISFARMYRLHATYSTCNIHTG